MLESRLNMSLPIGALLLLLCAVVVGGSTEVINKNDRRECSISSLTQLATFSSGTSLPVVRDSCNRPGEYVLFANRWVQLKIIISTDLLMVEKFKLLFFDGEKIICTMETSEDRCNHPKIQTDTQSAITRVVYAPAAFQLTIVEHAAPIRYDVRVSQGQFMDLHRPVGLCIDGPLICRKDNVHAEQNRLLDFDTRLVTSDDVTADQVSEDPTEIPEVILDTTEYSMTTIAADQSQSICHVYGDPHVIRFPAQPQGIQEQYWCRLSGQVQILANEFVRIDGQICNRTWSIDDFNIVLFNGSQTIPCTINSENQQCVGAEVRITRPSPTQVDIYYALPRISISLVTYEYQDRWYDLSIRMPFDLIGRTTGLCVQSVIEPCVLESGPVSPTNNTNSLSRQICDAYLQASIAASLQLGLSNVTDRHGGALTACIHDYETTRNPYFGASMIDMLVKYEINRQQLSAGAFELLTIQSTGVINAAIANTSAIINALIGTTTSTVTVPVTPSSSPSPSNSTTRPVTCITTTIQTTSRTTMTSTIPDPVVVVTTSTQSSSPRTQTTPSQTTTSAGSFVNVSTLAIFSVTLFFFF